MKDSPGLHLKTYGLIFFIVLFAPLGNVLLSKGMKGVGSAKNWVPGDIFHILASIITSGYWPCWDISFWEKTCLRYAGSAYL